MVFPERRRPYTRPQAFFGPAYLVLAALATLASARLYYGYMLQQTGGEWSAPLDDVFIHFDYARSTARGFPFQWSEGNGYSSGGTSVLYPFFLAAGYWVGFRGPDLMVWAAIVAAISVFGFLWSQGRVFRGLSPLTAFLVIPSLFSIGALAWSLWSGMEVAFFLGVWALVLIVAVDLADGRLPVKSGGWWLGAAGVLLVLTRPEGATSLAALGVFAAIAIRKRSGTMPAIATLLRSGAPAAIALGMQSIANKIFTGESAANGALVKLALENPYLTRAEKYADWRFNIDYAIDRLTLHHFGELRPWGWVPVWLALLPLFDRRTRAMALVLWASVVTWVLVVALNGQVRWQNERYLMPAVAWLLVLAALGLGAFLDPAKDAWQRRPRLGAAVLVAGFVLFRFWQGERVQYRDQVWFFGRASRNIRDQHTTAGRLLAKLDPLPHRLLVGDAGALLYASDLPGFDLIGLGGYGKLPLARAGVQGLAATLELLERVPANDRPDIMAIYPTWWPSLPMWFATPLFSVPVAGNVICGGAEKAIYRADWHLLGTGAYPSTLATGDRVVDEIDVADLISESEHDYVFPHPQGGYADMRVLPDPREPERDLWDGGRHIPSGRPETFRLNEVPRDHAMRLLFRTTVDRDATIEVHAGAFAITLDLPKKSGWLEIPVDVPASFVKPRMDVSVTPTRGEWLDYHVWVIEPRGL